MLLFPVTLFLKKINITNLLTSNKNQISMKNQIFFFEGKDQKKLAILNPQDFTEPHLGISLLKDTSLGLADPEEIARRNEIVGIIFRNPDFGRTVAAIADNPALKLPTNGNDFMAFYQEGQKNRYWELVDEVISAAEKEAPFSLRLSQFLEKLRTGKQHLYEREMEFGKRVNAKLKATTVMAGYLQLYLNGNHPEKEERMVIGQRAFNAAWSSNYDASIPDWAGKKLARVIGLTGLVQGLANATALRKAMRSTLITSLSGNIERDIRHAISNTIFDERYWDIKARQKNDKAVSAKERDDCLKKDRAKDLRLTVAFAYDKEGLKINIINVASLDYEPTFYPFDVIESRTFDSLTMKEKAIVEKKEKLLKKELIEGHQRLAGIQSWNALGKLMIGDRALEIGQNDYIKIAAPQTDAEFSSIYLQNIYTLPENRDDVAVLMKQRAFFSQGIAELEWIAEVVNYMKTIARTRELPLCVPTIVSEPGIVFKNLAPIDMLNQSQKKMVPFSFPKINGQMIALTGRHGRGKSVAGNSILQSLWLAQSGLPVFAEDFTFDVKDAIGAVTNDHGEGSTATVFVQKVKNLLENISKIPAEKSLIFIDEIGKGTQEAAGLELGKRILTTLGNGKYSVLFNTQILALAEHAHDQLGAKCFKVDDKHQFAPGIGGGEMEALVKEIGLDAYLK